MRSISVQFVCSVVFTAGVNSTVMAQAYPEWTLYAPFQGSTSTYLIDLAGNNVHTWSSNFAPGIAVYLLDDGALMRTCNDQTVSNFGGGGRGGRIQKIAWDGTIEWNYVAAGPNYVQHHDIEILPNGNVLVMAWERFTGAEAVAMGRDPAHAGPWVWSELIYEIEPTGPTTGDIVWEWHVWDHLVQNLDPTKPNYGNPADHPGRIDINFGPSDSDWLHWNAIDYNAELDQIVVSSRTWSEIWILSHEKGHSGDLVYRWGNPRAYGRGTQADQMLFGQHDPEWIPDGLPGEGNITIFNNGDGRGYSSVVELDTGVNPDGTYTLPAVGGYGPSGFVWECDALSGQSFFSLIMSGLQRMPNGNSLVCPATAGTFIEIDANCNVQWSFAAGGTQFRATRIGEHDPRLEGLLWCYADCDENTMLNIFDYICFGNAYSASELYADCDGNGSLNVFDYICFGNAYAAGCP
ncbi:MAG: aryl-sulfate sulfotransferase [Phycisphaeraceae bacterium]|nr:aryl-sulfate sulfotransferase [Phycisphaerales bacterium]MCB9859880.1 aryl-sulfate sulfotransferase [Phycisphaeraceae bacterium]